MNLYRKFLSIVLVFAILFTSMLQGVSGKTNDSSDSKREPSKVNHLEPETMILNEITSKREKNVKHFLNNDNTYTAEIYPFPVHFKEGDEWKDIDNTMFELTDENNARVLENKQNSFKVRFAKSTDANKLVVIKKDGYEISWAFEYAEKSKSMEDHSYSGKTVKKVEAEYNDYGQPENLEKLTENEKKTAVPKVISSVNYTDILQGVDLKYEVISESIKESIIIKDKITGPCFRFSIHAKGLRVILNEDNSITFFDEKDQSVSVLRFNAPFMIDNAGQTSHDIAVSLEEQKNGYTLILSPNNEWLNAADRSYPVIIDPTVEINDDNSVIKDAYVESGAGYADTNYGSNEMLNIGHDVEHGTSRSYIKFQLPALTNADMVTKSEMTLSLAQASSSLGRVDVHKVTSDWNQDTIIWNNAPLFDSKITDGDFSGQQGQQDQTFWWNITSIVKDWYTTGNNYGVVLKNFDETGSTSKYYSSECTYKEAQYKPFAYIKYTNSSGLEDYWTYHSIEAGRAGTGYINDYTGNLVLIHNDLSMNGNRLPIVVNHIYNSSNKDVDMGYGTGWRLNFSQTLTYNSDIGLYEYVDEDGTIHFFPDDKGTFDESGLNLKLTENADGTYTIVDKKDNKINFNYEGLLISIVDNYNNQITINYGSNGNKPASITDSAGRVVSFTYTDGKLTAITDPANRTVASYFYTNNRLTGITYLDNNSTTYTYWADGNLEKATNYDGYMVSYAYYEGMAKRIQNILESNVDGTLGKELSISYGYNTTTFTDESNRKNLYQFNNSGNTICIVDGEGNAQYYTYFNSSNIMRNKLSLASNLQRGIMNYITNHSFETWNDFWNENNNGNSAGSLTVVQGIKYAGRCSGVVEKTNAEGRHYYSQGISLTKGKTYTLSGYVKTSSVSSASNKGALVFVKYKDESGNDVEVKSEYVNGSKDWTRLDVTFTLPVNSTSGLIDASLGLENETGTAYFDCVQLEESAVANRYNLIENPDFASGLTSWVVGHNNTAADGVIISTDSNYPASLDRKCYAMEGVFDTTKYIYQDIEIGGSAGDKFVLGGWAKGQSAPIHGYRRFNMEIEFHNTDGTSQYEQVVFNEESESWQFMLQGVTAEKAYDSVTVYCVYDENFNTACFDGIQLYKEKFGWDYGYDSNGNLNSTDDSMDNSDSYVYNQITNDLEKYSSPNDPNGLYPTRFYYNSNHRVTSSRTSEGIQSYFTYDTYGNLMYTTIGSGGIYVDTSKAYTSSGNYVSSSADDDRNRTYYYYDESKGITTSIRDAKQKSTYYTYDTLDRLGTVSKTAGGSNVTNSYTYENDKLKTITHNNFSYAFGYDSLGNSTNISVGSQTLITHSYMPRTSLLSYSLYGNNQKIGYEYDNLDRVTKKKHNDIDRFKYSYNAAGLLGYMEDLVLNMSYKYTYNNAGRLETVTDSGKNAVKFAYDANNNVTRMDDIINGTTHTVNYSYDKDDRQSSVGYGGNSVTYTYDAVNRVASRLVNTGTAQFNTVYNYKLNSRGRATYLIESINNNGSSISYTYDANRNISTISGGSGIIEYTYNELDEVVRENNQVLNKTITYSYDAGGNLTGKMEYPYTTGTPVNPTRTYTYSYGDSNWKDKLTSFDGNSISYDAIGNPLEYDGWTYTWEEGRQLTSLSKTGSNVSYKYNDNGIRTQKTVDGVTTNYRLVGDKVTYETDGADSIYYTYDAIGKLISMNLNGVEYYYIRNGQDDILGLFDSTGTQVVTYTYDTWGKLISITGTLANTVGMKNPYRYRGYRYDTETGLYYLQSRYYNPEWGRFLNADDIVAQPGELLSANMFAYCGNNPVKRVDPDGHFWMVVAAAVGGVIGTGIEVYGQLKEGKTLQTLDMKKVAVAGLSGAATGALAATGIGLVGTIAANAGIAAASSVVNDVVIDKNRNISTIAGNAIINGVSGAIGGAIGGPGAKYVAKQASGAMVTNLVTNSTKVITPVYSTAQKIISTSVKTSSAKGASTSIVFRPY